MLTCLVVPLIGESLNVSSTVNFWRVSRYWAGSDLHCVGLLALIKEMKPRKPKIFVPFSGQKKVWTPKKGYCYKRGAPLALCCMVNLALVMSFIFEINQYPIGWQIFWHSLGFSNPLGAPAWKSVYSTCVGRLLGLLVRKFCSVTPKSTSSFAISVSYKNSTCFFNHICYSCLRNWAMQWNIDLAKKTMSEINV